MIGLWIYSFIPVRIILIYSHTRCCPEFCDKEYSIAVIVIALYGLTTSTERFKIMLANFLRTLGCLHSRYDRDVWMRLKDDKSGYYYICTHLDDFKVVAKNPSIYIEQIVFAFIVKQHGPGNYYLVNDYTYHDGKNIWTYGCQTYTKEVVSKVERINGCLPKESITLPDRLSPRAG